MVFLKLLLALPRLAMAVFKLVLKLVLAFTVLAFVFGAKIAMVVMVLVTILLLITFINNLFSVLTEGAQYNKSTKTKLYKDDDYWTPGEPAITQKAFTQGFYDTH